MPALAAAIASWLGIPNRPQADDSNTMEPPIGLLIYLTEAFTAINAEVRLVLKVSAHSSSLVVCDGFNNVDPTQLTTPLISP